MDTEFSNTTRAMNISKECMNYSVTVTLKKSHIFMTCFLYFQIILISSCNLRSDAILGSVHYLCCTCSCHIFMKVITQHEGLILRDILFTALTLLRV